MQKQKLRFAGRLTHLGYFRKFFLAIALVFVCALFAMTYVITSRYTASTIEKDTQYNQLILSNVVTLIKQKERNVLSIAQHSYDKTGFGQKFLDFLVSDESSGSLDYFNKRKDFNDYINSLFAYDRDIVSISVFSKAREITYTATKNSGALLEGKLNRPDAINIISDYSPHVLIFPAITLTDKGPSTINATVFSLAMNIKDINTFANIGTIIVDFDVNGISRSISQYYENITGQILIMDDEGQIIFDSTGMEYGERFKQVAELAKEEPSILIEGEKCIVNQIKVAYLGITTVGIIPYNKALAKVADMQQTILLIAVICLILALCFTFLITRGFEHRIRLIQQTLYQLRHGKLEARIPLSHARDELYDIAHNINRTQDEITQYIDKAYIAELKQKNAELIALQAQINPHFIFNTLEAIRMKAITVGAREIGEMLFILSRMFRNSVKGGNITSIEDEIEQSKLYLKLFEIRHDNVLITDFEYDESTVRNGTLRHILQPIIENYILHGFNASHSDNKIKIKIEQVASSIILTISDNGYGIDSQHLENIRRSLAEGDIRQTDSIGLANVHERLRLIFGPPYGLQIESEADIGTQVEIKFPAMTIEEMKQYVQSPAR